jgi:sigma-54 dependent transcriptional regulator, acetoin dehydrogenase operon transcriptional activator AcoR
VETSTITGDGLGDAVGSSGQRHARLVFLADADDPGQPSSVHALDQIDEVRFRRGARAVERRAAVLSLSFPDARMSSEHGRLVRSEARWVLDDPASKNGAIVDGVLARRASLGDGAVIELGHSFFLFRQSVIAALPGHLAGDLAAAGLPAWPPGMATFSPELAHAYEALARVAAGTVSVVLLGETGTGKEVIARAVHALSQRRGELVAVNCGALPAALIEAELFGHRRGAFSGAVAERAGLIRSADRGTLFLDEIGELPRPSQAAFLRVLQEREVLPVGDDRPVAVDLRLVTATLRDLDAAVAAGTFRADLRERIAGHTVVLPPLRARREDLGLLIAALRARITGGGALQLAPAALRALVRHDWPGNIRELETVLATACAVAPRGVVELEHLPPSVRGARPRGRPTTAPPPRVDDGGRDGGGRDGGDRDDHARDDDDRDDDARDDDARDDHARDDDDLDDDDRALRDKLVALFTEHGGNVVAVAQALGKRRTQIYKWVRRLGIDLSAFRRRS